MAGIFDFLHIKGRTAGSSNELSFDVLDHASSQLEAPQPTRFGTLVESDEVRRRKQARRANIMRKRLAISAVVIVLLCVFAWFAYGFYQAQTDFSTIVNRLVAQIVQVDESLVEIDTLMKDPFDGFQAEARTKALEKAALINEQLIEIADRANELAAASDNKENAVTFREVAAVAQARQAMLGAAMNTFRLSEKVINQQKQADLIWVQVMGADQQARDAAALANSATTEQATIEARDATQEAINAFEQAKSDLQALQNQVEGLSFKAQIEYLNVRVQALENAVVTSNAILAMNREEAAEANDAYNEFEQQAAELAAELPASPGDMVLAAYSEQMKASEADYDQTRASVTKVDADLRSRLP